MLMLRHCCAAVLALISAQVVLGQTPEWIWGPPAAAGDTRYFRRNFLIPEGTAGAALCVAGDDEAEVFLNGRLLVRNADPKQASFASLPGRLVRGENMVGVVARNRAGGAGLLLQIEFTGPGLRTNWISDTSWLTSAQAAPGWATNPPAGGGWVSAVSLGKHGMAPWGDVMKLPQATPAESLTVLPGFTVELVRSARPGEGSWIAMTVDDKGRFIVSPQGSEPLQRFTVDAAGKVSQADPIFMPVRGAMGLLHAFGALYVNGQGAEGYHLYRLTDTNSDDRFDRQELLRRWTGATGEHGAHAIVKGPDDRLYVVCGNFVSAPPDLSPGSPARNYADDLVLPKLDDGNNPTGGRKPPEGFVVRLDRDGVRAELFAAGLRNCYDLALDAAGELFAFESDQEADWGTPWFLPNRVLHLPSGADLGYRETTGKWPDDYPDRLPTVVDVGLGSPTGVEFGTGTRFPAKYQRALFALDWSFGRILAVHLRPAGGGFTGEFETVVQGKPLNVTDAEVAADGALYFITGGRGIQSGLYRLTYVGGESTAPAAAVTADDSTALRRRLAQFHGREDARFVAENWATLGHADRAVRFAARVALEHQPVATWADRALAETNATAGLTALLALARVGGAERQLPLLQALTRWPLDGLGDDDFLLKLRVIEVSFARHGIPAEMRPRALEKLGAQFPAKTWPRNRELVQLLAALQAPDVLGKALDLRDAAPTQGEQFHYQFALCRVTNGWTMDLRRRYFRWFGDTAGTAGRRLAHPPALVRSFEEVGLKPHNGSGFENYLKSIRTQALKNVPAAEVGEVALLITGQAPVGAAPAAAPTAAPAPARKFVRDWKTEDLLPQLGKLAAGRNRQRGREVYAAAQCAACHRLEGQGGAVGPDLVGVGTRYSAADLVKSLTEPSAVISEQYQAVQLRTKDGREIFGRFLDDAGRGVTTHADPLAQKTVEVPLSAIESRKASPISPMPEGLLNTFEADEILDLLSYLQSPAP
jgi:putative heme-binding domain-containing protein